MKSTLNIVIPMAGEGSRFRKAGYTNPKPFIDVKGKPMIRWVIENLQVPGAHFILIARREHLEAEKELAAQLEREFPLKFVTVNQLTEGTACTVLFAREHINNDTPLLIANSDQWVDFSISDMLKDAAANKWDGSILTFTDHEKNPKWSFARVNDHNEVLEVKEKQPISDKATVGIYYFAKGKYFVDAAIDMIVHNDRVNNEFYTCPVYNWAIRNNNRFGIYDIPFTAMHGLGTPEDLHAFLQFV
jgi:UDP-N-acetylglucosamine diphosphorylase / glucose-1-phosphate thymidylyltransferase / UDP-N-acetylgalactosamine diphosphorylase / glucosamine-1-phosphate N-acetyltransferase / galactosamine-1-phosphate N-acetyltransferase